MMMGWIALASIVFAIMTVAIVGLIRASRAAIKERDDARSRVERWAQRVYELEGELQKAPYRNSATGRLEKRPPVHLETLRSLLHGGCDGAA